MAAPSLTLGEVLLEVEHIQRKGAETPTEKALVELWTHYYTMRDQYRKTLRMIRNEFRQGPFGTLSRAIEKGLEELDG